MIIVVMGVAGSGKTTVGTQLAAALGCEYLEGDSLHPCSNVEKMRAGAALSDADRAPWLAAIRDRIVLAFHAGRSLVVGCSALKKSYRAALGDGVPITWVHLKGPSELIRARLHRRTSHFLKAGMLDGQISTLEEPDDAVLADISQPVETIVEQVLGELRRTPEGPGAGTSRS